jgi:hypothetical protein
MLSRLQFSSPCRKSIRKKWSKNVVKTSTTRGSPLTAGPSLTVEAEKDMDGEIDALFSEILSMLDIVILSISMNLVLLS